MLIFNYLKNIFKKKYVKILIFNILIPIILFYFILINLDFNKSIKILNKADVTYLLISIKFALLQVIFNNLRWYFVIKQIKNFNFFYLLRYTYIISFLNQVLPSNIGGELYKIFITKKIISSLPLSISINLFEKFFVLLILLLLILITGTFFEQTEIVWLNYIKDFIYILIILLTGLVLILTNFKRISFYIIILKKIEVYYNKFFSFLIHKNLVIKLLIISAISHINLLIIFKMITISVGVNLDFLSLSFIFFVTFLLMQLPISIGGWGVREASIVSGLFILGVNATTSFIISALFGLSLLFAYLPAIFLILNRNKFKINHH